MPRSVTMRYIDVDMDYQTGAQNSPRLTTLSDSDVTIDLSIGFTADEAKQKCWSLLVAEWIERGMLEMPADLDKALGVKIIGPAPPSPDLGEDAKAAIDLINNNLSSADMQIERLGLGDGEEIRTQRAVERQREIELGIVPLGVPGAVAMTASEPVPKADGGGEEQES